MGCCPRIPAVSTWDTAANKKKSILRALRRAQLKEKAKLDEVTIFIEIQEKSA